MTTLINAIESELKLLWESLERLQGMVGAGVLPPEESTISNMQERIRVLDKIQLRYKALSRSQNITDPSIRKNILNAINSDAKKALYDKQYNDTTLEEIDRNPTLTTIPETEPFEGYTKIETPFASQEKAEGKQKKAPDTGMYVSNTDGKIYYIKQSIDFTADNVAEVATSDLLRLAIGEQAVQYSAAHHKKFDNPKSNTVYIASEVSAGFRTLKETVGELPDKTVGADLITKANKDAVYSALKPEQYEAMARVLAGCLWVHEPDCQYGNMLVGKGTVKKFDNGWGLVDICKPKHRRVALFTKRAPVRLKKVGTHGRMGIPTNHFNDYPAIVRSEDFVAALGEVLKNTKPEKIENSVKNILKKIKEDYKDSAVDEKKALKLFAEHIGLDVSNMQQENIEARIRVRLARRLKERADSMAVLQCLLKIDLALQDNKELSEPVVKGLINELRTVITERFTRKNGYRLDDLTIGDIIPPFSPPRDKLMRQLIENAKREGITDGIPFCELLTKKGKKKPASELINIEEDEEETEEQEDQEDEEDQDAQDRELNFSGEQGKESFKDSLKKTVENITEKYEDDIESHHYDSQKNSVVIEVKRKDGDLDMLNHFQNNQGAIETHLTPNPDDNAIKILFELNEGYFPLKMDRCNDVESIIKIYIASKTADRPVVFDVNDKALLRKDPRYIILLRNQIDELRKTSSAVDSDDSEKTPVLRHIEGPNIPEPVFPHRPPTLPSKPDKPDPT